MGILLSIIGAAVILSIFAYGAFRATQDLSTKNSEETKNED